MAESYITRRGYASGGIGNLAVYTGDSPPSDADFGIFAQTNSQVDNIIIESPVGTAFSLEVFSFATSTSNGPNCITPDETKLISAGGSLYTNVRTNINIFDMTTQTYTSVYSGQNRTASRNATYVLPGMENTCYMVNGGFYSEGNDYYTNGEVSLVDLASQTSSVINANGPIRSHTNLIDAWNDVLVYQYSYQTASNGYLYLYVVGYSTSANTFTNYFVTHDRASGSWAKSHRYLVPLPVDGKTWYFLDQYYSSKLYYFDAETQTFTSGITYSFPSSSYPAGVTMAFIWDGLFYGGNNTIISSKYKLCVCLQRRKCRILVWREQYL